MSQPDECYIVHYAKKWAGGTSIVSPIHCPAQSTNKSIRKRGVWGWEATLCVYNEHVSGITYPCYKFVFKVLSACSKKENPRK